MRLIHALVFGVQLSAVFALPAPKEAKSATKSTAAATTSAAAKAGETEGAKNELNVTGTFGTAVALGGGNVKTDVLFTKSATGSLEVEFQNAEGRQLTVTENKTPAPPPAGFTAIDSSSFKIVLSGGSTKNLTLQKVDYVLDKTNPAVAALDIAKGQVGKLCTETNTFVISPALGELEFEADEGEYSLTVADMNGEWGVFIPTAATAENATEKDELSVAGVFNKAIAVSGGNKKTDILFTAGPAGSLEVEFNGTAANSITVIAANPSASPPAGFLFVDGSSFKISTASATSKTTDTVKVDYIFTEAVKAAADVTKGVVGKFDVATKTWVTTGLGEFELEADENEWTLTVADLNGEWALLIPQSAVLNQ